MREMSDVGELAYPKRAPVGRVVRINELFDWAIQKKLDVDPDPDAVYFQLFEEARRRYLVSEACARDYAKTVIILLKGRKGSSQAQLRGEIGKVV